MTRIAVEMDTDTIPVTGVDMLEKHLDDLFDDPNQPLKVKLFDDVELQLTDANILPLIPRLLPSITKVLLKYQQDPAILCSLTIKLLRPLTLTQILSFASEDMIIQAMRSPAPSANILAMAILEKAAKTPAEAAILAMMKNVLTSFLTQWLSAPQVEVGEKGSRVLGDLLDIDCDTRPQDGLSLNGMEIAVRNPPGQGLMWRRIFHDRDIYALILSLCSPRPHPSLDNSDNSDVDTSLPRLTDQQRTLAQGRLLRVLPRLAALNLTVLTRSDFPDINQTYAGVDGDFGLLHFAALHMIDNEDTLMHLNLIDFFEALLSIQRITAFSAYKIDTLRSLVSDATAHDPILKAAILSLPDRTVPDEADELRRFIHEVTTT